MSDTFWRGKRVPFAGPGADKGTLEQVAPPLTLTEGGATFLLVPLEVQRVSGAGGLYLVLIPDFGAARGPQNEVFLGKNVRLLQLDQREGVVTATVADARLGRLPSVTMQPGRSFYFRLESGRLLEVDR